MLKARIYFQKRVAPKIEGFAGNEADLWKMVNEEFVNIPFPDAVKMSMDDPEDLIRLHIKKEDNFSVRVLKALNEIEGIDVGPISNHTWKVKELMLLEPHFASADIKHCRKRRKEFMTKINLYFDLLSAVEKDGTEENDLVVLQDKILKLEHDETIQSLSIMKRKVPPKVSEQNKVNNVRLIKIDSKDSDSITLTQMEEAKVPND